MKVKVTRRITEEIEIGSVYMRIPVRYEEDIPNDFPFRKGNMWEISFTPEGQIIGWTKEHEDWFVKNQDNPNVEGLVFNFHMKVCDEGYYEVRDVHGKAFLTIKDRYVPHCLIPGSYGDYVELDINSTGEILNLELNFPEAFYQMADDNDE